MGLTQDAPLNETVKSQQIKIRGDRRSNKCVWKARRVVAEQIRVSRHGTPRLIRGGYANCSAEHVQSNCALAWIEHGVRLVTETLRLVDNTGELAVGKNQPPRITIRHQWERRVLGAEN